MAVDTYIQFDGVEDESKADGHEKWSDILAWSWSASNAGQVTGGGSGKGKADMGPLSFTKLYSKSSTVFAKKLTSGMHFDKVELHSRKSGDGQQTFHTIVFKEAFIDSISVSCSSGGEMMENITMSYGFIEHAYKPQDAKGGLGGEVKASYDLKTTKTA